MEVLKQIGENPLLVSLITIALTTIIAAIGYLIKKVINKEKDKKEENNIQQSNIIQNFNTGVTYKEVREIAEEVVERELNKKQNKNC